MRLTVQVATKLNRSHLVNGEIAYLLPCLGRTEEDLQASGAAGGHDGGQPQLHPRLARASADAGQRASPVGDGDRRRHRQGDAARNPKVEWDEWVGDYGTVRDLIEATYPEEFKDFNDRLFTPGGFYGQQRAGTGTGRPRAARPSSRADGAVGDRFRRGRGRYRLITLRSNDQFNTTIYGK